MKLTDDFSKYIFVIVKMLEDLYNVVKVIETFTFAIPVFEEYISTYPQAFDAEIVKVAVFPFVMDKLLVDGDIEPFAKTIIGNTNKINVDIFTAQF